MTKIYISGGPGSGKTTYAKKLSKKLNIPHFDLDEIKYINIPNTFNKERPKEERIALLDKLLKTHDNWICEGVYFRDWILPVVEQADKIIILTPSVWCRHFRVIKRSFRRLLHLEPKKHKENPLVLWALLRWSHVYEHQYLPLLLEKIKGAKKPYEILKTPPKD